MVNKTTFHAAANDALTGWVSAFEGWRGAVHGGLCGEWNSGAASNIAFAADRIDNQRLVVVAVVVGLRRSATIHTCKLADLRNDPASNSTVYLRPSRDGSVVGIALEAAVDAEPAGVEHVLHKRAAVLAVEVNAGHLRLLLRGLDGLRVLPLKHHQPRLGDALAKPPIANDVLLDAQGLSQVAYAVGLSDCNV